MTPVIRSGTPDDIEAVLDLWRGADAVVSRTDDVDGLRALLRHDAGALVLADDGGAVVGSVICAWDGWRGSVYRLAVAPTHRRQGLGRRLIAEAESRLAARGARRVQAIVVENDDRATGFWRAGAWDEQAGRIRFVR